MVATLPETLPQKISRWRSDPDAFVREMIGARPDPWQTYAMRALISHGRLSITACHGVGKDALAAWLVLWSVYCWPNVKVPCTAPTQHQLYDLLWAEIAKWREGIPAYFRAMVDQTTERLEWRANSDNRFAVARTARKENSEAMQGFHADTICIVVDEASGVPEVIFQVLEGAMTGDRAYQLLIGNPTQPTGFFADSHGNDTRWHRMRIMAAAAHDGGPVPAGTWLSDRVSPAYVDAIGSKYGKDSNVYRVRVLGLFPRSSDDQTIPLEWIERATMRDLPPEHWLKSKQAIVLGVDVARFGDDRTALVARQGECIIGAWAWQGQDVMETTGKVLALARRIKTLTEELHHNRLRQRPGHYPTIVVDGVGVGGGVADALRTHIFLDVIDCQAGETSTDDLTYRKRDQLWWDARLHYSGSPVIAPESTDKRLTSLTEWTPQNPHIDPEIRQALIAELATPLYSFAPNGRIRVESKQDVKERIGGQGSPDIADAHNLTLAVREIAKPPLGRDRYEALAAEDDSPWTV